MHLLSEYKSLKYWEKFGVWAGLATIVSLLLTVYMLIPNTAPTENNDSRPSKESPTDRNQQTIKVNTNGESSSAIVAGHDVVVNPNEDSPVHFLNAGNPPERIILFEKPVFVLMDSASNKLGEVTHRTTVAVIAKQREILNIDDIEDQAVNGLRIVEWKKVRLKNDSEKNLVGWVVSRFVDVR